MQFYFYLFRYLSFFSNNELEIKKWDKLNNFIYIDRSSIEKREYSVSGWFKIYNVPENELYNDKSNVYYELHKYDVNCKNPAILLEKVKSYDKKNNLIDEYVSPHGVACICPCIVNDEIYVRELCK